MLKSIVCFCLLALVVANAAQLEVNTVTALFVVVDSSIFF